MASIFISHSPERYDAAKVSRNCFVRMIRVTIVKSVLKIAK